MLSFEKQAWCYDLIFKIVFLKYLAPLSINIVINKYNLIISAIFPPQDRSHFAKAYWCVVELFLFIFH